MKNIYLKNFGIWLGIPLFVLTILPVLGFYFGELTIFVLIAGTILSVIMTHKENGGPIEFKKTLIPILIVIGGTSLLSIIITMFMWGGFGMISWVITSLIYSIIFQGMIAIMCVMFAGIWYMYEKANQPGWAAIVPIYNLLVLLDIAKKPRWWIFMFFIPIANIVFLIMTHSGISKNFGKDDGFTVGLVLLGQVFMAILGFGDAVYVDGKSNPGHKDNSDLLDAEF